MECSMLSAISNQSNARLTSRWSQRSQASRPVQRPSHGSRHLRSWLTYNVRQNQNMLSGATIFAIYLFLGLLCGVVAFATRSLRAQEHAAIGDSEPLLFWIQW